MANLLDVIRDLGDAHLPVDTVTIASHGDVVTVTVHKGGEPAYVLLPYESYRALAPDFQVQSLGEKSLGQSRQSVSESSLSGSKDAPVQAPSVAKASHSLADVLRRATAQAGLEAVGDIEWEPPRWSEEHAGLPIPEFE